MGTTDVPITDVSLAALPTVAEIDYLSEATNRLFPAGRMNRNAIQYAYAGIRPLTWISAATPGSISRRHSIIEHSGILHGVLTVVCGKITTYRRLSAEVVDRIARRMADGIRVSNTHETPLPGDQAPE